MKKPIMLLVTISMVFFSACIKKYPPKTEIFTGVIYSSLDSLPIKNTVFEIFTIDMGYNTPAYINNSKSFTTDGSGSFSVSFEVKNLHHPPSLKWPYETDYRNEFFGWTSTMGEIDNPNAGNIYIKPQ